jgi:parallel beta helix pectate lyase-like protein
MIALRIVMRIQPFLGAAVMSVLALPAVVASNRVFVSPTGVDAGTCAPISSPCRNFAYAMTQVSPGGEVIALATAGYGPVTISQSVAIVAAPGATAFISAPAGQNGVGIGAGPGDVVTLRGLAITSNGGQHGIYFGSGLSLNVENCIINGFTSGDGINFYPYMDMTKPRIQILNSILRNNYIGITLYSAGSGTAYLTVANCSFTGNVVHGIFASDNARVSVSDSVFTGSNTAIGAGANADDSAAEVNLDRCTISRNAYGVRAGGSSNQILRGLVRIANCTITGNDVALAIASDGVILSRISNGVLTNTIEGNSVDGGVVMGTYSAK